ncbi:neutral zinc metallopeptidase [Acinetobacter ursingii]|uniref:Neutral zinc metallopeptidase n=1 Tax=Acinetobacter ursingii TaxID=108980 RepID=A0A3D2SP23_9GAMM|nr:neutral zinc metallopeptidase [Acinetobacter ursingii]MCH2006152.1 neutral zinc metallopeptidase [Acinetobacter ursingii]MCU4306665.1 neutral zinc metallopeptidase [Acinetobacter ursingii]MCU4371911.1 neutral zinc metallopeptidase [Acinetobacter ursingii]MCU4569391.1 neutral zinc metallopeptidase [Acinetobacter ursingii]MCU4608923.1 neutral zinc metallopeptidase [Acinetobacter ursingii]
MRWKGRRISTNVEDRRGGGAAKAGGISILGLIVAFVAWKFFGVDPQMAYQATKSVTQQQQVSDQAPQQLTPEQEEASEFVGTVLADTEDTWSPIFKQLGGTYTPPKLVMFSGAIRSGCGTAQAAMGPFYCPADQKVYIDTAFFKEMRQQMGISGEQNQTELSRQDQAGDFAQAYVIAHEVGHHVQNLLGISSQVQQAQAQGSRTQGNQLSVRLELQADCFAGIWANHNQQRTQFLEQGDIEEAMDAAQKIGDDYLQKQATGQVVPDSFTHGTSQQRMHWFQIGLKTGDLNQCNTFESNL